MGALRNGRATLALEAQRLIRDHGLHIGTVHGRDPVTGGCACPDPRCGKARKHPAHGYDAATDDPDEIAGTLADHPEREGIFANFPRSGLCEVDVDTHGNFDGHAELRRLEAELGFELPETPTISTASGGSKYIFKRPENHGELRQNIARNVELRTRGGIILPPSLHQTGGRYEWVDGRSIDDVEIAGLPPELVDFARRDRSSGQRPEVAETIPDGERNATLASYAGALRRTGAPEAHIRSALRALAADACDPPWDDVKADAMARSIARYPAGKPIQVIELPSHSPLPSQPIPEWPVAMSDAAFHGVIGRIVRTIEPHTEADVHAVLVQVLVNLGNAVGRAPYVPIERDRHGTNLFAVIVGASATARKGVSSGQALAPVAVADPQWAAERQASGISSGEGLIHAVRDPVTKLDRGGETVVVDPGVTDKRLNVVEPEFGAVLRRAGREGNTISTEIRQTWDARRLQTMTRNAPITATAPHVSIVGHITHDELAAELRGVDHFNGFANRFMFILVRRSKTLPFGGRIEHVDFTAEIEELRAALTWRFLRWPRAFHFDADARDLWAGMYVELIQDRPGLLGHLLARGPSQVLRMALIYALADRSRVLRVEHLRAAREVFRYVEDSTRIIFGGSTGSALADRLLALLTDAGPAGLTRTEIRDALGRHARRDAVDTALALLAERDLATEASEATKGRPSSRWTIANAIERGDKSDLATKGSPTP
jgi:hypothetical protein